MFFRYAKGAIMGKETEVVQVEVGSTLPRWGGTFSQKVAQNILRLLGWRIQGTVPDLPQCVVIGAPHTSNWDWLLVMATSLALGIKISWMVKHTVYRQPLKWFVDRLGGIPVDRRAANGIVGESVRRFQEGSKLVLCITPEGTRSKVKEWKTGFYHIAQGAGVPIVPAIFDYGRKQVRFAPAFVPTGDMNGDIGALKAIYAGVVPKNPHLA